jgi:DNA-binding LacI/PurR family transcriptional regulator
MEQPASLGASARRGTSRVSMHDVAARAGVTQKTVSRVVNNERHVAPATRERVLAAIRELGFRPNAAARALVNRQSRRLGMVTVSTALYGPASILDGVEHAARSAGYALSVIRTSENNAEELQRAVDQIVDQGAEGVIISEPIDFGHPHLDVPPGVTVLSLDHATTGHRRPDELVVGTDEPEAARSATEHLLALGHRTVWHIAGPENWASSRGRIEGWRTALADADAAEPEVLWGDWTPRSGFDAMRALLQRPDVTAVFAANDHMAVGAMRAIRDAGLRVPRDVSVVGFDDDPVSAFLHPPLTTMRQDFAEVTRLAVHQLVRTLEGHPPTERQRPVPARLTIRSSTGRPHHGRTLQRSTQDPPLPPPG